MPPLAELVSTRTRDDVLLHGAFFEPTMPTTTAALVLHGSWGNFYTVLGRFLPTALAAAGIACLSLNTRGHDYGTVADREPSIGMMRERFEDCTHDIAAGLALLKKRGYSQLVILGHSFGAQKAIYSQVFEPDPMVRTLIACSPGLPMGQVAKHYVGDSSDGVLAEAKHLVESGQGERFVVARHEGPVPVVFTARVFLSLWGLSDASHDSTKYIGQLCTPTLITVCEGDFKAFRQRASVLFDMMEKAEPRDLVVLPKGEHYYVGAEELLQEAVLAWMDKLGLR
ncbi:MAG: alpha/beta fold hydrolase [Chloroflexota bacterium]|nr:MAG: alpha/beta fold hydrolase [Chloroflexota bacterium]